MRLAENVVFGITGSRVYLRNIPERKDHVFNETAYDILEFLKANENCTADELIKYMTELYDADPEIIAADTKRFVKELIGEKIIIGDIANENNSVSAMDEMKLYCAENKLLFSASMELTYRCSERCVHCYVDDEPIPSEELDLDEYKRILDELRSLGCMKLLLTGGEVCLKDCFPDIAEYAVKLGMAVDIYTNGINLTDELFDRIKAAGINSMSYSLYGSTPEVHDAVTGVKGSFEKTLKSVMTAKCAGIDTFIKAPVMKENSSDIVNLMKLGKRLDIPVAITFGLTDTNSGVSTDKHKLGSTKAYIDVMKGASKYGYSCKPSQRASDDNVCGAGLSSISIDPYGNVTPCISIKKVLGNLREKSLREIWENSPELDKVRTTRFNEVCKKADSCKSQKYCSICMACLDRSGSPSADTCMTAEAAEKTFGKGGEIL